MLRTRIAAVALAATALGGAGLATASGAHADPIGDGVTAPSHEPEVAVGNLCRPLSWLIANFSDHNRDIAVYKLNPNSAKEIAEYAKADIVFHGKATWPALFGFADPAKYCAMDYGVWDKTKADLDASNAKVATSIRTTNDAFKASINRTRVALGLPVIP